MYSIWLIFCYITKKSSKENSEAFSGNSILMLQSPEVTQNKHQGHGSKHEEIQRKGGTSEVRKWVGLGQVQRAINFLTGLSTSFHATNQLCPVERQ